VGAKCNCIMIGRCRFHTAILDLNLQECLNSSDMFNSIDIFIIALHLLNLSL